MWPRADSGRRASRQAAVIDVGSNSVRLVIYTVDGRALWTVYNEKVVAGLGRDLPTTGRLSREGAVSALGALRRFRAVLDGWRAEDVTVVGTAAVREAADGKVFLRTVKAQTGLTVRVLSGVEEARFAALGVICGQPDARGVVGDLGGSSLELVRLNGDNAYEGVTLPLGPFALGAPNPLDANRVQRVIDERLSEHAPRFAGAEFHAVGGAWRNLALLHMQLAGYPLHVAHQYEISRTEGLELARFVQHQSRPSLERIEGLSKRRFDTLPYSALVLDRLIERLGVERIVVSAYGVREGLLLDGMPADVQRRDPLLEGCESLVAQRGEPNSLSAALEAWVSPLFEQLPSQFGSRDSVLLAAGCRLADLGARLHPDHRADLAFELVLRAPLAGMTHIERCFLAMVAFSRHSAAPEPDDSATVSRILTADRRQRARALGAAIRLGSDLSGRNPRLLERSNLRIAQGRLILSVLPDWQDMLAGEQTTRRAQNLANALKLKLELT